MIENNPVNISAAFEMLLEEIEDEVDFVHGIGSRAFESRDYDKAREALERVGGLIAFRDKVAALRKEWDALAASASGPRMRRPAPSVGMWAGCARVYARRNTPMIAPSCRLWRKPVAADP